MTMFGVCANGVDCSNAVVVFLAAEKMMHCQSKMVLPARERGHFVGYFPVCLPAVHTFGFFFR